MAADWQAVVNAVLYAVQFENELGPAQVQRISTALLTEPLWDLTPAEEYAALVAALGADTPLNTTVGTKHSETTIRGFLNDIVQQLDSARPWTPPPFLELPESRWPDFSNAPAIAHIDVSWPAIEARVKKTFKRTGDEKQVLLLRLRSGIEVGLVWPGPAGQATTMLVSPTTSISPATIVREVVEATSLTPDSISLT